MAVQAILYNIFMQLVHGALHGALHGFCIGFAYTQALGVRMLGMHAMMCCSAAQHGACIDLAKHCRCNIGSHAAAALPPTLTTKVTNFIHGTRIGLPYLAPGYAALRT